ncbi:LCP family protein [Bacillus paramycoides]|uniref:LCP family protein n=1 Tax=Bacillus paramycoides TaxID=2026194 RepID=A0A1J9URF5_9BACI|nr:LCP family protein [Bacillus paramycoides]MED0959753.1 LCP family protein [Bacillus paramycoides]MED0973481.1 LCP family protein [Bacillus paramycoides]MED0978532.1 LCP family protein [Bacillus paramycoides]MED0983242.1 LCP family protein [Bacillus paramycoides]MED1093004.1 LCP family protein [Bacillus paramycoides]
MENTSPSREKKNKRKYKKTTIISVLLGVLLFGGVGYGTYVYMKTSNIVQKSNLNLARGEKSNLREKAVKPITHNVSILIMGIDENQERQKEYNGAFHTDALLLATFNKDDKTVKLTSIPRDTYTYVPIEKKKDKITHAYGSGFVKNGKDGGPQASVEAVEKLLQVPVDYFVKFNFGSFIKIVDGLDGVEVDVPVEFTEQNSKDEPDAIHLKKGVQKLTGEEALALARTRHIDSDAMRGQRQQLVIEAILSKLKSVGSITKLEKMVEAVDGDFKTNLALEDMLSFYKYGLDCPVEKIQLAGDDLYLPNGPNGQRVYYYNPNKTDLQNLSNTLRTHLGLSEKRIEGN